MVYSFLIYSSHTKREGIKSMAWKERTVEQMREEFAKRVLAHEKSKSALCREYGISRPTGDKWLERYQNGEAMSDRSRAPNRRPGRISPETETLIVERRKANPVIGAVKQHRMLQDEGYTDLPCVKTFNDVNRGRFRVLLRHRTVPCLIPKM